MYDIERIRESYGQADNAASEHMTIHYLKQAVSGLINLVEAQDAEITKLKQRKDCDGCGRTFANRTAYDMHNCTDQMWGK